MTAPQVGEKVTVLHTDQFRYIFHVRVMAIPSPDEFTGRVEEIFAEGAGEITGGDILKLKGQEMNFGTEAIIS